MKPYIAVAGTIFAIVFALHIWRLNVEGAGMLSDPYFAVSSILSLAMALWGARLLMKQGA